MCFQQMEIYTCTVEIPAIGPGDYMTVLCGASIAARGSTGRYKAMPGAPHKLTDFPTYCESAIRSGNAGTDCPDFELRWVYTPDPQERSCYEHAQGEDKRETEVLERERKRLSIEFGKETLRSQEAYIQQSPVTERGRPLFSSPENTPARDRGESPWLPHAGSAGIWNPPPPDNSPGASTLGPNNGDGTMSPD